jgi:cytochrome P450
MTPEDLSPDKPEAFDVFREVTRHRSFGPGSHLCRGLRLARLETRVALSTLLDRLPNLRLDHDQAQQPDVHIGGDRLFRSPNYLRVVWDQP